MTTLAPSFMNVSSSFLQVTRTTIKAWMALSFGQVPYITYYSVSCPYVSKKLMYYVVTTLALSFLIGSSSILQVMIRTSIKA